MTNQLQIPEYLQTFARFPQTLRVFFGGEYTSYWDNCVQCTVDYSLLGGHDNGYSSTLAALENEQLSGKLVILQGYSEVANELQRLSLPSLKVDGLFMTHKLHYTAKKCSSSVTAAVNAGTKADDGPISPQSRSDAKLIDPSLVRASKATLRMYTVI